MENFGNELTQLGYGSGFFVFFVLLVVTMVVLNGISLWKAARNGSKGWFIVLLLTNTIILELLYIFIFSKSSHSSDQSINNRTTV